MEPEAHPIFSSILRIIGAVVLVIIAIPFVIYGYYRVSGYFHDRATLPKVEAALTWIENFYDSNARYPIVAEFDAQFPDFKDIGSSSGYNDNYGADAPQGYSLWYNLSHERDTAPGDPASGIFGYEGHYQAWECPRWTQVLQTTQNNIGYGRYSIPVEGDVVDHIGGSVFVDFYKGEVYFKYIEGDPRAGQRVSLLQNLDKPRLFWTLSFGYSEEGSIVVTDGDSVYRYIWDRLNKRLIERKLLGPVPKGCVENTHHFD